MGRHRRADWAREEHRVGGIRNPGRRLEPEAALKRGGVVPTGPIDLGVIADLGTVTIQYAAATAATADSVTSLEEALRALVDGMRSQGGVEVQVYSRSEMAAWAGNVKPIGADLDEEGRLPEGELAGQSEKWEKQAEWRARARAKRGPREPDLGTTTTVEGIRPCDCPYCRATGQVNVPAYVPYPVSLRRT